MSDEEFVERDGKEYVVNVRPADAIPPPEGMARLAAYCLTKREALLVHAGYVEVINRVKVSISSGEIDNAMWFSGTTAHLLDGKAEFLLRQLEIWDLNAAVAGGEHE